jgi:glycosyltransferase involved in cell wall biosynthesis
MNVLFITHEKNLNGASKSMLNLIDELSDKHTFYVVSSFSEGPVVNELRRRGIKILYHPIKRWVRKKPESNIKWLVICMKWRFYNCFINQLEAKKLEKEIRDLNIDLIHTNTSVINLGSLLHKRTQIPHVWYVREFGQEDFGIYPLEGEKKFFKTINTESTKVITVSKALAQKYQPHIAKGKLETIYNGIGAENVITKEPHQPNGKFVFLIAGTVQPGKGQNIAVYAAEELVKRGILNFKLYIAGSGDTSWLVNLFPDESKYVTFLGRVSDMCNLRKTVDVELVCSKREAFGRVTAEAMMGGIPVIGANTGGTPELIVNGENGFIYEQANAIELADKMEFFIKNPDEIERMGKKAQEYAMKNFTIERCAREVNEMYNSVLNHNTLQKLGGGYSNRLILSAAMYTERRCAA